MGHQNSYATFETVAASGGCCFNIEENYEENVNEYFKVGDRVILDNIRRPYNKGEYIWGECEQNPIWGGKYGYVVGTIIKINPNRHAHVFYKVRWDNATWNYVGDYYSKYNLKHYEDEIKEEFPMELMEIK